MSSRICNFGSGILLALITLSFLLRWSAASASNLIDGPVVGNGGGAWVCRDHRLPELNWVKLTDLYEMEAEHGWKPRSTPSQNYRSIYESVLERASSHPKLRMLMDRYGFDVITRMQPVANGARLTVIRDGFYRVKPQADICGPEGNLYYAQLANFTNEGRILVSSQLWNHPLFGADQKAALMAHEYFYKIFRDFFGDKNSVRTRSVVAALFAEISQDQLLMQLENAISMKAPDYIEDAFNPSRFRLSCSAEVLDREETISLASSLLTPGPQSLRADLEGFLFEVQLKGTDWTPSFIRIYEPRSGAETTLGSSELTLALIADSRLQLRLAAGSKRASLRCWLENK